MWVRRLARRCLTVTLDTMNPVTAVTVTVRSADGTANAPADYTAISQVVTIPAGALQVTVTVPVVADALAEADETVGFTLSNPFGASLGNVVTTTLTITDDDSAGVQIAPTAGLTTTETGGTAFFRVKLQPAHEPGHGYSGQHRAERGSRCADPTHLRSGELGDAQTVAL